MSVVRPQTFGDLLRQHRQAAGLTQEELAEQANLSLRAISDLERGIKQHPRRQTLQLLAAALNLDGSTVTRQVTALQTNGLIERHRDPKDGRGTVIAATPLGLQQVETVRQARRVVYGAVLKDYSDAEKRELAAVLERFTEALAEHMRNRV